MPALRQEQTMKNIYNTLFVLLVTCLLTVLSCLLTFYKDNKYTFTGPQASKGLLYLTQEDLVSSPLILLVDEWAYYPGHLLTPADLNDKQLLPDEYIYIGCYGGFEANTSNADPHGSASYRLRIKLPATTQHYSLELPEIFSSYRTYINGRLMASLGNPDPLHYWPETRNRTITFEASGSIDILIAVSDFSHLYSGMVYPPAFGTPDAVSQMVFLRFLFRAVLSTAALTIGILSLIIGLLSKGRITAVLYGLLCLFFVGYISYPITKTFFGNYYPFYALENILFSAMLFLIVLLGQKICQVNYIISRIFSFFSLFLILTCFVLHVSLPKGNIIIFYGYSYLISFFQWGMAGYLTVVTLYAIVKKNLTSKPLLIGITAFDTTLLMDRLLPLHEPIVTGWFPELGSFFLILMLGLTTGASVAQQYKRNTVLEARAQNMTQLLQMQRTYYPLMLEKIKQAKTARHDLRHHLVAISGLLDNRNYDGLRDYLSNYQQLPLDAEPINYSQNEVADILAHYYTRIAKNHEISLSLRMDIDSNIAVADDDLCSLLSNLLENAIESCLRQTNSNRFIAFTAKTHAGLLAIYMENSCQKTKKSISGFLSAKRSNRTGYGIDSIRLVARKYNGNFNFQFDKDMEVFTSQITLELE